jgi:hypothetical protein
VGVHILGNNIEIFNSVFSNQSQYGIKEDDGSTPVVTYNIFRTNTHDYYDDELTVIDINKLNEIPGNEGNESE